MPGAGLQDDPGTLDVFLMKISPARNPSESLPWPDPVIAPARALVLRPACGRLLPGSWPGLPGLGPVKDYYGPGFPWKIITGIFFCRRRDRGIQTEGFQSRLKRPGLKTGSKNEGGTLWGGYFRGFGGGLARVSVLVSVPHRFQRSYGRVSLPLCWHVPGFGSGLWVGYGSGDPGVVRGTRGQLRACFWPSDGWFYRVNPRPEAGLL